MYRLILDPGSNLTRAGSAERTGTMLRIIAISLWLLVPQEHVTMTGINFVEGTDSLKIFCKMNFDDFLTDLQTIDDDRNLNTIFSRQPFPSDLINQYFNSKVFIYVNNKLLIGKLLAVNKIDNELNMHLLYKVQKKPRVITVKNIILTGWYSDQTNLMIMKIGDFEKGVTFTPDHSEETFTLK